MEDVIVSHGNEVRIWELWLYFLCENIFWSQFLSDYCWLDECRNAWDIKTLLTESNKTGNMCITWHCGAFV
jgi:hypothetical protein